jgi:ferritin
LIRSDIDRLHAASADATARGMPAAAAFFRAIADALEAQRPKLSTYLRWDGPQPRIVVVEPDFHGDLSEYRPRAKA